MGRKRAAGTWDDVRLYLEGGWVKATPAFNLGVALEDRKRYEDAVAAYQSAIAADPSFADAYFNLSGVYEKLGRGAMALRHLKTYRQLVRGPL